VKRIGTFRTRHLLFRHLVRFCQQIIPLSLSAPVLVGCRFFVHAASSSVGIRVYTISRRFRVSCFSVDRPIVYEGCLGPRMKRLRIAALVDAFCLTPAVFRPTDAGLRPCQFFPPEVPCRSCTAEWRPDAWEDISTLVGLCKRI